MRFIERFSSEFPLDGIPLTPNLQSGQVTRQNYSEAQRAASREQIVQVVQASSIMVILGWCVALPIILGASATRAEDATPQHDAGAIELLSRTVAPLQSAKTLRVQIHTAMKVTQTGAEPTTTNSTNSLTIAKPDRVALRVRVGRGTQIFCDGNRLVEASIFHQEYSIRQAPKSLADYFAGRDKPFVGPLHQVLIKSIFAKDAMGAMLEDVDALTLAETQQIAGQACRRLHFVRQDGEWDFWIDTSKDAAIRQLDFSLDPKKTKGTAVSLTQRLSNWDFNPTVSEKDFAYLPPKDWKQVPPEAPPGVAK